MEALPEGGRLDDALQGMSAAEIIDQTLHFMSTYHTKRVLYRSGDHIRVGSMKLLHYYQNRSEHLHFEVEAGQ